MSRLSRRRSAAGSSFSSPSSSSANGTNAGFFLETSSFSQIVVGAPQIDEVGVEDLVLLEERSGGVGAVVDGAQVASHERPQVGDQRVGEPLVGARVRALDRDHQRRAGAHPIADLLERLELGILLGQELAKVGAELQAGRRQQRQHEQHERRAADREVVPARNLT